MKKVFSRHSGRLLDLLLFSLLKKVLNLYQFNGITRYTMSVQVPFPIIIIKEGKWFVASCPLLDIATQGKTENEVKENMADLINDYLTDPDTSKDNLTPFSCLD